MHLLSFGGVCRTGSRISTSGDRPPAHTEPWQHHDSHAAARAADCAPHGTLHAVKCSLSACRVQVRFRCGRSSGPPLPLIGRGRVADKKRPEARHSRTQAFLPTPIGLRHHTRRTRHSTRPLPTVTERPLNEELARISSRGVSTRLFRFLECRQKRQFRFSRPPRQTLLAVSCGRRRLQRGAAVPWRRRE